MSKGEEKFGRCIDLLEAGNWVEGMKLYHWRYHPSRTNETKVRFSKLPLKFVERGTLETFKNKKVLVLNEQGLGDDLMFFRGLHYLSEVAAGIAWQTYNETSELFKINAHDAVQLFSDRELSAEWLKQFDCYTTTGNLFSILNKEGIVPLKFYMSSRNYDESIPESAGICWGANLKSPNSELRSFDPDAFRPLLADAEVYSLMHGEPARDWMVEHEPFKSLCDTADLISKLQVILTVDTSVAHLAGSLGKKTFVVIKDHHDWRWRYIDENGYSLLYPSVKVVRYEDLLNI